MSKKWLIPALTALLVPTASVWAQNTTKMADAMRGDGRIYVVVAVLVTILLGLIFYVYRIDRRISRLEKDENP
jgi:ABC-type amino acid transport system permease subunit